MGRRESPTSEARGRAGQTREGIEWLLGEAGAKQLTCLRIVEDGGYESGMLWLWSLDGGAVQ